MAGLVPAAEVSQAKASVQAGERRHSRRNAMRPADGWTAAKGVIRCPTGWQSRADLWQAAASRDRAIP